MNKMSSPENTEIDPLIELIGSRLSNATILFHTAVAERLGVSASDMKAYTLLRQSGPLTAGELAEHMSLTTGAITGMIDRLERAGLVRRTPDPKDRRRVVVELQENPERDAEINALYLPMGQAISELVMSYSEAERGILEGFLRQATGILERETARLREK